MPVIPLPTPVTSASTWLTPADLAGARLGDDEVDLTAICVVTADVLFRLSGRRYGVREKKVRPTKLLESCSCAGRFLTSDGYGIGPFASPGLGVVSIGAGCECPGARGLTLSSPVREVLEVKVDGVVLGVNEYELLDHRTLVRTVDSGLHSLHWPCCQRIDAPDTELGTWAVTYRWGADVPEGGKLAAKELGTELAKLASGCDDCALPDRVTSLTRQGVSLTLLDPQQFLDHGRTGLYLVDLWLNSVNPHGLRRRPTISSPETVTGAVT